MLIQPSHILITVVYLATCCLCSMTLRTPRTRRQAGNASTDISADSYSESEEMSSESSTRWLSHRESQMLLRREGGDEGFPVDCCPSVLEMTEPLAGTNRDGLYVRLYSIPGVKQRFYETSCRVGVEGKPCRFMDRHLHNQSRCMQQYSYSYALVEERKPFSPGGHHKSHPFPSLQPKSNYSLDYIQVHSGCACVVSPRSKRRRSKSKRGKE